MTAKNYQILYYLMDYPVNPLKYFTSVVLKIVALDPKIFKSIYTHNIPNGLFVYDKENNLFNYILLSYLSLYIPGDYDQNYLYDNLNKQSYHDLYMPYTKNDINVIIPTIKKYYIKGNIQQKKQMISIIKPI